MRWNREHIKTGMTVRSSDGEKLGKVIAKGDATFEIEKGFFILKDYLVRYSDILDVRDGEAYLRYGKQDLQPIDADRPDEEPQERDAAVAEASADPAKPLIVQNANRRAEELAAPGSLPGEAPPGKAAAGRYEGSPVEAEQTETFSESFTTEAPRTYQYADAPTRASEKNPESSPSVFESAELSPPPLETPEAQADAGIVETEVIETEVYDEPAMRAEEVDTATLRADDVGAAPIRTEVADATLRADDEATTIPLARERLTVTKHDTRSGEVRIHKSVETETETVEVPLRRERVNVEHVQTSAGIGSGAGEVAFEERDYTIPLHGEEVEVRKETVVDEELRVTKVPYEEKKRISERLRHEHAEVRADSEDDLEERGKVGWRDDEEPTRY